MSELFDFNAPRNQYAVMGNPVAHSRSPQIHTLFAEQCGIRIQYDRIQVDSGGFKQAVSHFAAHDGAGLNVTVPFKVEAWDLCQRVPNRLSGRAVLAEAVNTLKFAPGTGVFGDNTDGVGLVKDLTGNLNIVLEGRRVLMVGAGGAVRGVLGPLLECQPASLHIVNRTASKASLLAERFNDAGFHTVSGSGLHDSNEPYDVVINGTAASLGGEVPDIDPSCIRKGGAAYDMMYGAAPTMFMRWAADAGATQVADGLGMLVEQAAESFRLWHDKSPDSRAVITTIRNAMQQ